MSVSGDVVVAEERKGERKGEGERERREENEAQTPKGDGDGEGGALKAHACYP